MLTHAAYHAMHVHAAYRAMLVHAKLARAHMGGRYGHALRRIL